MGWWAECLTVRGREINGGFTPGQGLCRSIIWIVRAVCLETCTYTTWYEFPCKFPWDDFINLFESIYSKTSIFQSAEYTAKQSDQTVFQMVQILGHFKVDENQYVVCVWVYLWPSITGVQVYSGG